MYKALGMPLIYWQTNHSIMVSSMRPHQRSVQQSWQAARQIGQSGQTGQGPTSGLQSFAAPMQALRPFPLRSACCCWMLLQLVLCSCRHPIVRHFVCLHVRC